MINQRIVFLLWVASFVVLTDQVTKHLVHTGMAYGSTIPLIPGLFDLTHVHNPGGAFGFLAGQSELIRKIVFIFVSGLATLMILYFYHRTPMNFLWLRTGLALIFGGAVGNMTDRIRFGYVIDFFDVYWKTWHWPAFNVADSAICVGMGIFVFHVLFKKLPEGF
ncbi:signal peptidase II [Desulfobotulus alkaliphilus]|uniref:Lipoprotein signal peptidase n=1 Tax=Desulfobotulus alkaliphilus TaxID=622671 RepID=A0A562RNU6_9BACT|nr:signal peptidase II [Desulfobotulus alkaliphilus]TWI70755.1 signal peptidase II [Desulfobotulus alkaliphilus]